MESGAKKSEQEIKKHFRPFFLALHFEPQSQLSESLEQSSIAIQTLTNRGQPK